MLCSNFQDLKQELEKPDDVADKSSSSTVRTCEYDCPTGLMIGCGQPLIAESRTSLVRVQEAPKVLVVSVASTTDFSPRTTTERVVKRQVELTSEVKLGAFCKKDFCILVLSDGEELHIPRHMLGDDVTRLLTEDKELVLTTPPRTQDARPNVVSVSKVHGTHVLQVASLC